MATAFQTLKETMHARLTTRAGPQLTSFSQVQGQANAISWKGMTLLGEATTIIGQAVKSLVNTVGQTLVVDDFPADIDGAYLTSRVLVIGPPRKKLADKDRFRNDASRIREFICQKHGTFNNTLCFDFAPSQSHLDSDGLRRSVVQFDLDRPTLETLREACAAVVAWLDMDEKNVALLTCTNGIKSTCLVAACVWAELSGDTIRQGLCKFFEERLKLKKSYSELLQKLPPSYDRLLKTYEREKIENENMEIPLQLTRVVARRAPFRSIQGDVQEVARPIMLVRAGTGFRRVERKVVPYGEDSDGYDDIEGLWAMEFTKTPLILSGDVSFDFMIHDQVIFSLPLSIGSFNPGRTRFGPDTMDEAKRHLLPGDFELEVTFKEVERLVEDASFAKAQPCGKELCSVRHIVKASKHLVGELMANFEYIEERDAIFALQRTNNDYAKAALAVSKQMITPTNHGSSLDGAFFFQGPYGQGGGGGGGSKFVKGPSSGVLLPLDGNSGKKPRSANGKKGMTTPLKRKLEGEEEEDDPTLSPFLRETIGKGLSSPVTPARPGVLSSDGADAVGEMDKVLLSQLAQLLSTDATMVQKVGKLAEGKATIVELDKVHAFETPRKDVPAIAVPPPVSASVPPTPIPIVKEESANAEEPILAQHEVYGVFFKMLKMGVPRDAVEQKMKRDGFVTKVLDFGPNAPVSRLVELEKESQKTLGQDERFIKYFQMVKMGVPPPAVQQRMDRDGVPREALDLGENAPVTKLDELLKQKAKVTTTAKKKITKQKTIRWDAIPEERLQKGIVTIWHHAETGEEDLQLTSELENLFIGKSDAGGANKSPASTTKAVPIQQESKVKSLLDARRAQSVCIGLAKLKMSGTDLANALMAMDEQILTSRTLQVIQGCNLLPSMDEATMLGRQTSPLAEPDLFLLQLFRGCPDSQGRIEALTFRYLFGEIAQQTSDDAGKLATACGQVRSSGKLKDLLRVVLLVGNQINNSEEEKIRAFTLASLLKLSQTRSLNKTTTVLEYLVQFLMNKMPTVLDVAEELNAVPSVKRMDLMALLKQSKELRKGLEAVSSTYKGLEMFCRGAFDQLAALDVNLQSAKQAFEGVLDYFGEDREMTSVDFFTTLSSFLASFGQTRKDLVEREKRNARKKQQMLLAQQQAERKASQLANKPKEEAKLKETLKPTGPRAPTLAKGNGDDAQQEEHPHLAEFLRNL